MAEGKSKRAKKEREKKKREEKSERRRREANWALLILAFYSVSFFFPTVKSSIFLRRVS